MAMTQAQARAAAIATGKSAAEVDAFIASQGGARTSAQRITSAFNVPGSTGTNDLTAFHAQKATVAGADASGRGTYLSGAGTGALDTAVGGGSGGGGGGVGGGAGGVGGGGLPSTAALNKVVEPAPAEGGGLGSIGQALSAIGGGGAMGNQERVAVDTPSGGILRPLGMRRAIPMSMQVLNRRAY